MREITFNDAIREALREEMRRDPSVYIVGEDVALNVRGKVSIGFYEEFGERVIDTPIAEAAIIGTSVGAAMAGMRPVADLGLADFILGGVDVIINHASRARYCSDGEAKVPMVVRAACGHSLEALLHLESLYMHVPGLKVAMPSTPADAKGLLKSAIRDDNPVIFLEHGSFGEDLKGEVPDEEYTIPLGVADIKREGSDVTVVAISRMVQVALEAADELAGESISLEVIDLRSVSPMDSKAILDSVKKTGRLIVAHDAWKTGGIGAEISALVIEEAMSSLKAPVARVGAIDIPTPFNRGLRNMMLPSKANIMEAAQKLMNPA